MAVEFFVDGFGGLAHDELESDARNNLDIAIRAMLHRKLLILLKEVPRQRLFIKLGLRRLSLKLRHNVVEELVLRVQVHDDVPKFVEVVDDVFGVVLVDEEELAGHGGVDLGVGHELG